MNIKEKVIYAIKNEMLKELLEGKAHLEIDNNSHFLNISTPTDYVRLLKEGIYEVYNLGDSDILEKFEQVLEMMIKEDVFGLYCATDIIYLQLRYEKKLESPFNINLDRFVPIIKEEIVKNKMLLQKYYEWSGKLEQEGMYGYFERLNNAFIINYGFSIMN